MVRQSLFDPGKIRNGGLLLPGFRGPVVTAYKVIQLYLEMFEVKIATDEESPDSLPYFLLGWGV